MCEVCSFATYICLTPPSHQEKIWESTNTAHAYAYCCRESTQAGFFSEQPPIFIFVVPTSHGWHHFSTAMLLAQVVFCFETWRRPQICHFLRPHVIFMASLYPELEGHCAITPPQGKLKFMPKSKFFPRRLLQDLSFVLSPLYLPTVASRVTMYTYMNNGDDFQFISSEHHE